MLHMQWPWLFHDSAASAGAIGNKPHGTERGGDMVPSFCCAIYEERTHLLAGGQVKEYWVGNIIAWGGGGVSIQHLEECSFVRCGGCVFATNLILLVSARSSGWGVGGVCGLRRAHILSKSWMRAAFSCLSPRGRLFNQSV